MLNAALTSERLVAITASGLPTETSLDCVCYHLLPHERNDHRHRDKGAHEPKLGAMVRAAQGEDRGPRQEQRRAQQEPRHPRGRLEAGEPGQQSAHASLQLLEQARPMLRGSLGAPRRCGAAPRARRCRDIRQGIKDEIEAPGRTGIE